MAHEVLIFVFRNEADLAQANVSEWNIEKVVDERVAVCLSALMMSGLSFGGQENIMLAGSETRMNISVAFFLSILATRYKESSNSSK